MKGIENIKFFEGASAQGPSSREYYNVNADFIAVDVSGEFVATIVFEGKVDLNAESYTPLAAINLSDYSVITSGSVQSAGLYGVGVSGIQKFRVSISSYTSGSINVFARAVRTEG